MDKLSRRGCTVYCALLLGIAFTGYARPKPLVLSLPAVNQYQTRHYTAHLRAKLPADTVLFLCFKRVDKAVLWYWSANQWRAVDSTGETLPFSAISTDRQTLRLPISAAGSAHIRLAVSNYFDRQLRPDITVRNTTDFALFRLTQTGRQSYEKVIQHGFVGALLIMLVYTLIQALIHSSRAHTWYALYVGCTLLGFLFRFEIVVLEMFSFGEALRFVSAYSATFFALGLIAYLRFVQTFTPVTSALLNRVLYRIVFPINIAVAVADIFLTVQRYKNPGLLAVFRAVEIADSVVLLWTFLYVLRHRNTVNWYFLAGFCTLLVGGLVQQGLIEYWQDRTLFRPWVSLNWQLTILVELSLFTAALSYRNRQTEREKIRYQTQLIEQLRENEAKQTRLNGLRDQISRDLHDDVGGILSSISFYSEAARNLHHQERYGDSYQLLLKIADNARQTIAQMSDVVWSMRSDTNNAHQLAQRLESVGQELLTSRGIRLTTELDPDIDRLALRPDVIRNLYLIGKEAIHNAAKYSEATEVMLSVQQIGRLLQIRVADNGQGFSPSDVPGGGNGLGNMPRRADAIGATYQLTSEPAKGTVVNVAKLV